MKSCIENAIVPVYVSSYGDDFESGRYLAVIVSKNTIDIYVDDSTRDRFRKSSGSFWKCDGVKNCLFKIKIENSSWL